MATPLFTIITPCYNAERYLHDTVDSILKQKVTNWELLLIDDGSVDNTPAICDDYASKDHRIRSIHQKNGGVGRARNHGLVEAHGEWVLFIDADDWFTDDAFEIYREAIANSFADRLIFNRYNYKEGKISAPVQLSPQRLVRKGEEKKYFLIDMLFPYYDRMKNGVVTGGIRGVNCSLYRKSLIDKYHIRFEEDVKIAEDAMFNYDVMCHAHEVEMQNKMVGYYRINETSVMHRFTPDVDDINNKTIQGFNKRLSFLLESDYEFRIAWTGLVAECVFRAMKLKYLHPSNKDSMKNKELALSDWFNQDVVQNGLDYEFIKYLPMGKKQIIQCLQKSYTSCAFLFAKMSIFYLKRRKKI